MLTKPLDSTKFKAVCQTLGLVPQHPTQLALSAFTCSPQAYMSDEGRDIALRTVFLQDSREDADRIDALACTQPPLLYMSDVDKDIALQCFFLQDSHEDADRMEALASEWLAIDSGITPECEEAWNEYANFYSHRTYQEELEDREEEKLIALFGSVWTNLHFERTTSREGEDSYIWWPCYGEQLGDAYDPDADYSYHGTIL